MLSKTATQKIYAGVVKTNGRRAKCRSKVLQNAKLLTCIIRCLFLSGLLRQVLLYTIKFDGYPI